MTKKILLVLTMMMFLKVDSIWAMKNPAAVYCEEMGYINETKKDSEGNEYSYCSFGGSGGGCDAFSFFEGSCGQEHSYCQKNGWKLVSEESVEKCGKSAVVPCSLCVDDKGETIGEAGQLMNLNYSEGVCGDGNCVLGEDVNCPQDCKEEIANGTIVPPVLEPTSQVLKKSISVGELPQDYSCQPCLDGRRISSSGGFTCFSEKPQWSDFSNWSGQYLRSNLGGEVPAAERQADYNCDGKINLKDFSILWKSYRGK